MHIANESFFNCVYAPLDEVQPISINRYPYSTIPTLFGLEDTTALETSGILRLQNQPIINLKGQDTIVGIIDTGIDYRHEAFLNAAGQTRIEAIWDQTINDGIPPNGFFYGTEYTKEQINEALAASEPNEAGFIGAVPEATILVVKLKSAKQYLRDYYFVREEAIAFQENDIIYALEYLNTKANELRKPISIIIGVGSNRGEPSNFFGLYYFTYWRGIKQSATKVK